jgi:DNA-binding beta-propeller fold protein YncE
MQIRRLWSCTLALALAACSKDETPPPQAKGDGTVKAVSPVVNGGMAFRLPFDAALSPDGKTAYFTALAGDGAALFKSPARGGSATKLADLVGPGSCDVTSDGSTVLVADPGVESSAGELGAIVAVSAGGGLPACSPEPKARRPRASRWPEAGWSSPGWTSDGVPGVFQTSTSGGVTTIQKTGLIAPDGVTAASSGEVYVLDAEGPASATRRIVKVAGGAASTLVTGLRVGYPAGIALSQDENRLLVASTDPATGAARLERFTLSGMSAGNPATTAIGSFDEPGGLHRAAQADAYAYVDSGADTTGTVFVVNPL